MNNIYEISNEENIKELMLNNAFPKVWFILQQISQIYADSHKNYTNYEMSFSAN